MIKQSKYQGFTLVEILVALFIFTIISMILMSGLHNLITIHSGTEKSAERLRQLQLAMLLVRRDVEQTVNRPIVNASGKAERAFIGTPYGFTFTHLGLANPMGVAVQSSMQRTSYFLRKDSLYRQVWNAVDATVGTHSYTKILISGITRAEFAYLDHNKQFRNQWPQQGQANQGLPRAVKLTLVIANWGALTQIYVIPVMPIKKEGKQEEGKTNESS